MQRSAMGYALAALALILGLMLAGCHNDQRAAETTVRNFMEASKTGDKNGVNATLTTKAREKMQSGTGTNMATQKAGSSADYTIGETTVNGDTAQVPVTVNNNGREQQMTMKLRREDGEWRIYAMAIPLGPGGADFTFDFENPEGSLGEMFKGMGQAMGQALRGMSEGFKQGMQGAPLSGR